MRIKPIDKRIRFSERWNVSEERAVCSANGNTAEFIFSGDMAILEFDMDFCREPYPHIYISVDNGAKIEVPIDKYIRIGAKSGEHYVKLILKSSVEMQHRWFSPIEARVSLAGIEADDFKELPADNRKSIEFIGDSITEGVLIDDGYERFGGWSDRVFQDDATATYAWLTAENLNLRPIIMGYGAVGTTQAGCGSVPKVYDSYPFYSHENPMESANADYIVINHGTNDMSKEAEVVKPEYEKFLELVRDRNPKSKIVCLTPFCGAHAELISEIVKEHNEKYGDNVYYINSTGWVPAQPIHPLRDGHRIISEHLTEILKNEVL